MSFRSVSGTFSLTSNTLRLFPLQEPDLQTPKEAEALFLFYEAEAPDKTHKTGTLHVLLQFGAEFKLTQDEELDVTAVCFSSPTRTTDLHVSAKKKKTSLFRTRSGKDWSETTSPK